MADSTLSTSPESQQGYVVGSVVTLGALAFVSVGARIQSRTMGGVKFGIDDVLIVFFALPLAIGLTVDTALATKYGLGKHLLLVLPDLETYLKVFFATQMLWAAATPLVKLSILCFYLRIFNRTGYMHYGAWIMIFFTVGWMISVVFVLGLQCRPLAGYWDSTIETTCINRTAFYLAGSSTDVAADFIILLLPLPAIWSLQMAQSKKISIILIFILGGLTCIISLVRLIELAQAVNNETDLTWDSIRTSIWTVAEPCLGIVCASLPTLQPLMNRVKDSTERLTTMARSLLSTRGTASNTSQTSWHKRSEYEQFPESRDQHMDGIKVTYGIETVSIGKTQGAPNETDIGGHELAAWAESGP
ncbi:hypothetical protein VM1G_06376 [Cytospora mali]|uniref:Rhodopsin domain-containing protein n=1 Tax=Cytospora mali TaxID=578113 RepID=A0A194W377_CYTMA|nr:hypothetical protein VM1G_06376 [Valsa mali]